MVLKKQKNLEVIYIFAVAYICIKQIRSVIVHHVYHSFAWVKVGFIIPLFVSLKRYACKFPLNFLPRFFLLFKQHDIS